MAQAKQIICPFCGFKNQAPLANDRCVSCGAKIEDLKRVMSRQEELERRYQQEGFSVKWFGVSLAIMVVVTIALLMGLPMMLRFLDFEGYVGMVISIPTWFLGGLLIGLVSPGKTFVEPVAAVFLVAMPTSFLLHMFQTVKTMPGFMYILLGFLGVMFTLIGSYVGERVQMGPAPRSE